MLDMISFKFNLLGRKERKPIIILKKQKKNGHSCNNCSHWNQTKLQKNVGFCKKKEKFLASYYICDKHIVKEEK